MVQPYLLLLALLAPAELQQRDTPRPEASCQQLPGKDSQPCNATPRQASASVHQQLTCPSPHLRAAGAQSPPPPQDELLLQLLLELLPLQLLDKPLQLLCELTE